MADVDVMAEKLVESIKKYIDRAVSPLEQKISELEKSLINLPVPQKGEDGKSITLDDVMPIIKEGLEGIKADCISSIDVAIKEMPKPQDGKSITLDDVQPMLSAELAAIKSDCMQAIKSAIDEIPAPKNGKDADMEEIKEYIKSLIVIPEPIAGKDGENGKDALQIEIIPMIEDGKSYPRGTYAKHNGGLWHAYKNTNGMNGWECMVDGISNIGIEQTEEREFKAVIETSSGKKEENTFVMPIILDKGLFTHGREYKKGDAVTYGGSLWICQESNTQGIPGASKEWRLAVKRGRDGKEAVKIEQPKTVKV